MPLSTSSATKQLSDGNSNGTILGKSATDYIGFYGLSQGVVQPSGAAQAALARGVGGGIIATNATSQTPGGISIQSTNEVGMSVGVTTNAATGASFALASTDFLFVAKPTQQAGIGIGHVRYSTSQAVAVQFGNFSAATVTATAGEKYGIVALRGLPFITQTITPAVVSAATAAEQIFTVPGIKVGDVAAAMPAAATTNILIAGVRVAGANQVGITFANTSPTTATTPASGVYTFWSTAGVDAASNVVEVQKNIGALAGPTATNVSAQSVTMTGLAVSDVVMGLNKPTAQAILVGPAFVSGANALGINFTNPNATVTPTTYEVYGVTLWRPQPAAPVVNYAPALSPSPVPPNTTTSQLFTVTGLVANSVVWVNKPSAQPGLGIVGSRVSGANGLEITFCNATAATITPTAGETYAVANFQQAVPDVGDTWIYALSPQMQANAGLSNAIRGALVSTNLIAGA